MRKNNIKAFGNKRIKDRKQDSRNLGARKPKAVNRIAEIGEQENQRP
jgi:hypothetical protein